MAYSIKYLFKFESAAGTTREIRVLKDGYSGDVIQRPLGRAPMLKKQQNGPVHGTSLEFFAECNVDREFIEFYTSNPKDYRVDLYAGSTLLWQGYITPELYSEPDIAPPYDVQVVATDGVGELKLYDYAAQGAVTLRTLLSGLLSRTGLGTDIYLISSLKPGSAGAGSLLEKTINLDYMAGQTCYEVLTYILDTLHATITWWKGAWILTRETNVTFTNGKVRYFNTAGNSALLNDSVQVLGKMYTNPAWPVGQLSTVIDPAKNKIEVQAPWHPVTCLQNPDMTSDASWTKINSASYDSTNGGYLLPFPQGGTGQIRQQISMAGLRVPMSISVRATASTSTISGQVVAPQLGVLLIYTVGNASYHLRKGSDGAPVWESGALPSGAIPAGTQVDFQQTLSIWDASRIEAEELKVENIPAFMQGGAFPAGTMTVYIIGYCATVFSAHLDVVLPKGYADILHIGNGARGEGNTVEIAIGRESADNAYYAAFLQGLLLDSGSLITSFSDANFTTGMDYLAFIARDYALSVALPRAKVTGTVFLEGSVQIPPLVFTKGGLDYWVETWGWNLYEDELEISARTLPSASLTVQSETILESNGSTVSSAGGAGSSGSGSSMGGGGGTNYWEIDGTLNTLLKPKDAYAFVHSKDGLFFTGAALSGTVVPDLYVDTVNNQRVLRSPLPLITGGDQIVIDGTPGGGGGGGGATTLAGLDDTNITNPQAGQMLAWNGTKWVNTNAPTGSITSVSLAAGASNGTLHLVVNGTAQSDVAVTGLGSMAYKSSLAASDIPDLSATYLTTGTAASTYLPLSAGVNKPLTGNLYAPSFRLSDFTFGGVFKNGHITAVGEPTTMWVYNTDKLQIYGSSVNLNCGSDGSVTINENAIWHAGNFTPGNYVLKAGDTMTGTLTLPLTTTGTALTGEGLNFGSSAHIGTLSNGTFAMYAEGTIYLRPGDGTMSTNYGVVISTNSVTYNGYTMWHAGNDGAGSGLDADLLDGQHGSYYAPLSALDNYLPLTAGTSKPLTGSLYIITGDTDKAIQFSYATSHLAGASWRLIYEGSNSADNNYFSIQNGGSNPSNTTWYNVVRMTMDTCRVGINMDSPQYQLDVAGSFRASTTAVIGTTLSVGGLSTLTGGATIPSTASLKIGNATITWNSNGYLHIDQPLVTAGDQIVISGTPGGGGGGGATNLWGLDDVSVPHGSSTPSNGQVLTWDSTLAKWTNQSITSGVSSVVGQTGAVTTAQIATALTGAGYKLTDTTYDVVTASVNGLAPMFSTGNKTNSTSTNTYYFLGITGSTLKWYSLPANAFNNTTYSQGTGISISGTTISLDVSGAQTALGLGSMAYETASNYVTLAGSQTISGIKKFTGGIELLTATSFGNSDRALYFSGPSNPELMMYYNMSSTLGLFYNPATGALKAGSFVKHGGTSTQFLKADGSVDSSAYITGNQTISLSGDVSGSGTTSISVSIGQGKVTNAMLAGSIANGKLANSAITINGSSTSLGGSFSTASITAGTAGQSGASTGVSFSIPYVTMNKYGIVTAYGTHTHTISASDLTTTIGATTYAAYHAAGYVKKDGDTMTGALTPASAQSGVAWACSTLYASANVMAGAGAEGIYMNATGICWHNSSNSWASDIVRFTSSGNVGIGTASPSQRLHVEGSIYAAGGYRTTSGLLGLFKGSGITSSLTENDGALYYYTHTLAVWASLFKVNGPIESTGDQVVSSDLTLKTNLSPVTYSVSDIAKARAVEFDWRDGRGHSMGSIAQDWLSIAPALVHGEEGNMSLAYGQLALVNTIIEAREIETLKARVAELEAEVKRLRMN